MAEETWMGLGPVGGWWQAAKDKSVAALQMVRNDLAEFGHTMQIDAGLAIGFTSTIPSESDTMENDLPTSATETVKRGWNTLLDTLSQVLVVLPHEEEDDQNPLTDSAAELYDRAKARVHAIQMDPGTYVNEPSGPIEKYTMWSEGFDLEEMKADVSELLVSSAEVRGLYMKLVPGQVSHADFWSRYFYKLHQMDVDEARKEALLQRADSVRKDEPVAWDDDSTGDEAAEDSGSDWEKFTGPRQQPSPSSHTAASTSTTATTPSPASVTMPQQSKDSHSVIPQSEGLPTSDLHGKVDEDSTCEQVTSEQLEMSHREVALSVEKSLPTDPQAETMAPCSMEKDADSVSLHCISESFKDYLKLESTVGKEFAESGSQELSPAYTVAEGTDSRSIVDISVDVDSQIPAMISPTSTIKTAFAMSDESESLFGSSRSELQKEIGLAISGQSWTTPDSAADMAAALAVESGKPLTVAVSEEEGVLKTTERGDLVVIGSDHGSPLSNTSASKEMSDVEELEGDLFKELTEENMALIEEEVNVAKKLAENLDLQDHEWESWD